MKFISQLRSMFATISIVLLSFQHTCLSQNVTTPGTPTQNTPKTYFQLVLDLQKAVHKPSQFSDEFGYLIIGTSTKGGFIIIEKRDNKLYSISDPIFINNFSSPRFSSSNKTSTLGTEFVEARALASLKVPVNSTGNSQALSEINIRFVNEPDDAQQVVDALAAIKNCTTNSVSWGFLQARESTKLKGYVPKKKSGQILDDSGVTIATGFDIGQHSEGEINSLDIPETLKAKLRPYASPLRREAADRVAKNLTIEEGEALMLDEAEKKQSLSELISHYDKASSGPKFIELPYQAQTAIMSVKHQFKGIWSMSPKFWGYITTQNWERAAFELRHWNGFYENGAVKPDDYRARRELEAGLFDQVSNEFPAVTAVYDALRK